MVSTSFQLNMKNKVKNNKCMRNGEIVLGQNRYQIKDEG